MLERLAANTSFSLSRAAALALRPAAALSAVQELQHQTAECVRLVDMGVDAGMGGAHDIRPSVTRAERGGALDPAQLLDVRSTLDCAERIARTLGRLDEFHVRTARLTAGPRYCASCLALRMQTRAKTTGTSASKLET